jgi:type VI protein secretion system component VasK
MTVCKDVKNFSRTHERIADFFSVLAVALLFASIWAVTHYYQIVSVWLLHDVLLHGAILVAAVVLNVLVIVALLAVGSARYSTDDERCFGTFQGRRHHTSSGGIFSSWLSHMENVGKKHR